MTHAHEDEFDFNSNIQTYDVIILFSVRIPLRSISTQKRPTSFRFFELQSIRISKTLWSKAERFSGSHLTIVQCLKRKKSNNLKCLESLTKGRSLGLMKLDEKGSLLIFIS